METVGDGYGTYLGMYKTKTAGRGAVCQEVDESSSKEKWKGSRGIGTIAKTTTH